MALEMSWWGGGGSQPKNSCWTRKGSEDLNGSTEGYMQDVGATTGRNQTHHICGIASNSRSKYVVIQACGGLPEGPTPHEDWNISLIHGNHWENHLDHQTIKCMNLNHAIRSWCRACEKQPSQGEIMSPFSLSEAPKKYGSLNQGTPPSRHSSGINVLRLIEEGLLELRQWSILNKATRYHSGVTDGLTPGTMMEWKKLGGRLTTSLVIE